MYRYIQRTSFVCLGGSAAKHQTPRHTTPFSLPLPPPKKKDKKQKKHGLRYTAFFLPRHLFFPTRTLYTVFLFSSFPPFC